MVSSLEFKISAPAPTPEVNAEAENQRHAAERIVKSMQALFDRLDPEDYEQVANQLEAATSTATADTPRAALAASMTGCKYATQERLTLEFTALKRYFEWRRALLNETLTAPQVAQLLGTSRQTPHDRLKSGTLIAILDKGAWRFPIWQFDPEGPDGVIPGLPEVIAALDVPPLSKISWLIRPNPFLDGLKPIEALKRRQLERTVSEARGVGAK